jgi:hypothetical protein
VSVISYLFPLFFFPPWNWSIGKLHMRLAVFESIDDGQLHKVKGKGNVLALKTCLAVLAPLFHYSSQTLPYVSFQVI